MNRANMADAGQKTPWLNPGDRLALAVAAAAVLGLFGLHYWLSIGFGRDTPGAAHADAVESHLVDINRAKLWELQALQGVGDKKAQDIIDYRRANGGFHSVDDLARVSGIGQKTLDRLRPHLTVGQPESVHDGQ